MTTTAPTTSATTTGIGLVPEIEYRARVGAILEVGPGPLGHRMVAELIGGRVTGERICGELVAPYGDWALFGPDGWATLDIRGQIRTDDGALIYFQAQGHLEITDAVQQFIAGVASTDWDDHYARLSYKLECGDERYSWVNRTVLVGELRFHVDGDERAVGVRAYRVT